MFKNIFRVLILAGVFASAGYPLAVYGAKDCPVNFIDQDTGQKIMYIPDADKAHYICNEVCKKNGGWAGPWINKPGFSFCNCKNNTCL